MMNGIDGEWGLSMNRQFKIISMEYDFGSDSK